MDDCGAVGTSDQGALSRKRKSPVDNDTHTVHMNDETSQSIVSCGDIDSLLKDQTCDNSTKDDLVDFNSSTLSGDEVDELVSPPRKNIKSSDSISHHQNYDYACGVDYAADGDTATTDEDDDHSDSHVDDFPNLIDGDQSSVDSSTSHEDERDSDADGDNDVSTSDVEKCLNLFKKIESKNNLAAMICRREINSIQNSRSYYRHVNALSCWPRRLRLMNKLDVHEGCVNAIDFNASGDWLASGSDDLDVVVSDWSYERVVYRFSSGHVSNVFQTRFLPQSSDLLLATCARDGQVRLAELSPTGTCLGTRCLAVHRLSAHKLAVLPQEPTIILSCGEDAQVYQIDVRECERRPLRLVSVRDANQSKVALYSLSCNPLRDHEYCVSGRDRYVRVFDRRYQPDGSSPVTTYCPHRLLSLEANRVHSSTHITSAVYSARGDAILASYNDDNIFEFNSRHSDGADAVQEFAGHRNNATVKAVNYWGPNSEFVLSGSDCGNMFVWQRSTSRILQCCHADEAGVVNQLLPHPWMPFVATCGLDKDVKVWAPLGAAARNADRVPEDTLDSKALRKIVRSNLADRKREERIGRDMGMHNDLFQLVFRQLHRREREARRRYMQRGNDGHQSDTSSSDDDDESEPDDDDNEAGRLPFCVQQ